MMPGDWDYARALDELWRRSSYERGLISDPFGDVDRAVRGLARMRALLHELGDPHHQVPSVHVAGSKGKGSTANFVATAATAAGHRTGLYTSPHPHRFPERIAIDGTPVADQQFAAAAQACAAAVQRVETSSPDLGTISTFELVTAMGFLTFHLLGCDLAVIEVGLGGRYDSTNVIRPVCSVITRIDLEHTAVLGPTYRDIAFQKAGILRPGVPCLSSPQVPEAADEIARVASDVGAPLLIGGRDWHWHGTWRSFSASGPWGQWDNLALGVLGPHQVENACTALAALHVVDRAGLTIPETAARDGLRQARWTARFERIDVEGRTFVFDAAHTPAAAEALVASWREEIAASTATVILGMGSDKDVPAFLDALRPVIGRLVVTRASSPRATDPEQIARAAAGIGIASEWQPTVAAAIEKVRQPGDQAPVLVTGSLFVAGEAREALGLAEADEIWKRAMPSSSAASRRARPARWRSCTIATRAWSSLSRCGSWPIGNWRKRSCKRLFSGPGSRGATSVRVVAPSSPGC
jgi:dihydrofolate synthase / folylpolyglutamate synthase